jgi:CBS domain-containing protein
MNRGSSRRIELQDVEVEFTIMKRATDVMDREVLTVPPDTSVRDLAARLLTDKADGACVVEGGKLVGVVTAMDLIFQEQPVHLPSFFVFFDAVIPLERPSHMQHELDKLMGAQVKDIMSTDLITVAGGAPIDEVAATMVRRHTGYVPVVDGGKLLGVVTKRAVLKAAFGL